jgi:outer membrane receptor protein involved in Fe transport
MKTKTSSHRPVVAVSAFAIMALAQQAAHAQEALEEIVVTARKVAETLHDAPVSALVVEGTKLAESGISRIEELVPSLPNFAMSETGIGTNLYVRGIGSGINQGFEQSVGLYIDGIYYGRAQLTRVPFMDLGQAEALRGPQAILLGNNSIAGAINLVTKKPTDHFEASADLLYAMTDGEKEANLAISGPLGAGFSGRISGRYRGMDGYIFNNIIGREEPNRDERAVRGILAWSGDWLDASFKLEKDSFDVRGRQIEIIRSDPSQEVYRSGDQTTPPTTSQTGFSRNTGSSSLWTPGKTYLQYLNQFFDSNPAILNGQADFVRGANIIPGVAPNGDTSNNDVLAEVLNLVFHIGALDLTSTTGHLKYNYAENCDCDFTGAPVFNLLSVENYRQWSEELRLASPQKERFRYLVGFYYQADHLDFGDQIFLPIDGGVVKLVGYATTGNPTGAQAALGDTSVFRNFKQNGYVSSVFGQVGADLTDAWRMSLGVRYTHVEKEAIRLLREGDLNRNPFDINNPQDFNRLASGAVLFASIFKVSFHELTGFRSKDRLAWEWVTDYKFTPDVMVYGSVKTGFKSGGFDARSNSEPVPGSSGAGKLYPAFLQTQIAGLVPAGSFEFQDEKATSIETGTKIKLLDNTAEISVSLFGTKFDNLQVSIFDGTLGFNVGNAATAKTYGVEMDGRWAITDDWSVGGSVGYLKFRFSDFKNGQCNQGQATDFPDPSSPNFGKCDYTGRTNQYVAPFSGAFNINYKHPFGDLLFRSSLDITFTDSYNPSQNLDPRVQQDAYAELNLRLALGDSDGKFEVAVLARNLTDETIVSYANDTPLAFSQFGSPTFYGFVDRSRNFAVQASYKFGR